MQPTYRQLRAVRGSRSIYHNNAIQTWLVQRERRGEQCAAGVTLIASLLLGGAADVGARRSAPAYAGIGRAATPAEMAAWDIDVRPDFKGLPPGPGTVAQGQQVWEAQCACCHGVFGESNQVFKPLVGGTGRRRCHSAAASRASPNRRSRGAPR